MGEIDAGHGPVVTVGIQKGGTGKTATTVNLAGAFAGLGYRVGVMDFDYQRNTTDHLLDVADQQGATVGDVLQAAAAPEDCVATAAATDRIVVMRGPTYDQYVSVSEQFTKVKHRSAFLRDARRLVGAIVPQGVDIVLVDSHPDLGLWLQMALAISDGLLVPVKPEYEAVKGMNEIVAAYRESKRAVNPDLELLGILVTDMDQRLVLHKTMLRRVRKEYGDLVLDPVIFFRAAIKEGSTYKKPMEFLPGAGAGELSAKEMYRQLAGTVARRLGVAREVGLVQSNA